MSSPFLPHSNTPKILAELIDHIVESEEFRMDLMKKEFEFTKQIADPVEIASKWEKLFEQYMNNRKNREKISDKQIKFRQNSFFLINRLYLKKFKSKFINN